MTANGTPVRKPSDLVETDAAIVAVPAYDYVGRGALKLAFGLEHWQIDLTGRVVLDIGASTGGFTEVCLRGGAFTVYAVDVGQGQLHPRIAADARVVSLEKTDARTLDRTLIPREVDVVVCDVSFVSLTKVLSPALGLAQAGADLIALVKPQFEAGRAAVGKGGIVTDDGARGRRCAGRLRLSGGPRVGCPRHGHQSGHRRGWQCRGAAARKETPPRLNRGGVLRP